MQLNGCKYMQLYYSQVQIHQTTTFPQQVSYNFSLFLRSSGRQPARCDHHHLDSLPPCLHDPRAHCCVTQAEAAADCRHRLWPRGPQGCCWARHHCRWGPRCGDQPPICLSVVNRKIQCQPAALINKDYFDWAAPLIYIYELNKSLTIWWKFQCNTYLNLIFINI